MSLVLAVLQLATAEPVAEPAPKPTIEIHARVRARELTIEQNGEARLEVRADPALSQAVEVTRNIPAQGQQRFRNLDIRLDAQATLAPPGGAAPTPAASAAPEVPPAATPAPDG